MTRWTSVLVSSGPLALFQVVLSTWKLVVLPELTRVQRGSRGSWREASLWPAQTERLSCRVRTPLGTFSPGSGCRRAPRQSTSLGAEGPMALARPTAAAPCAYHQQTPCRVSRVPGRPKGRGCSATPASPSGARCHAALSLRPRRAASPVVVAPLHGVVPSTLASSRRRSLRVALRSQRTVSSRGSTLLCSDASTVLPPALLRPVLQQQVQRRDSPEPHDRALDVLHIPGTWLSHRCCHRRVDQGPAEEARVILGRPKNKSQPTLFTLSCFV